MKKFSSPCMKGGHGDAVTRGITNDPSGSPIAHGGNHASSFNGGNPRNGLAPQDRTGLPMTNDK
jgi:hypothetical protein